MAAHVPRAPGYPQMLSSGAQHLSGPDQVLLRNTEACAELARSLRATFGPAGLRKLVVGDGPRALLTGDAATVLRELRIEQPAADMLAQAVRAQDEAAGDGRAAVLLLGGALLERAGRLLREGLPAAELSRGLRQASGRALRALDGLCCGALEAEAGAGRVARALRAAVGAKLRGDEGPVPRLVAEACLAVREASGPGWELEPERVRVCRVPGGGLADSRLLRGLALRLGGGGEAEAGGALRALGPARVAVYDCAFEPARPRLAATARVRDPEELRALGQAEERAAEAGVAQLERAGVRLLAVGGRLSDAALHWAERCGLLVLRLHSRRALAALARASQATPLLRPRPPAPGELGRLRRLGLSEEGGWLLATLEPAEGAAACCTVVLRGSTPGLLDAAEQAVRDGLSTYRALGRDGRLVPGAGATEMELAVRLAAEAEACAGLEQYAFRAYAGGLEDVAGALVRNAGGPEERAVARLRALHQRGAAGLGFDLEAGGEAALDAAQAGLCEPLLVKRSGLQLAAQAALAVLGVDQVIVAKKSGGPKPRPDNPNWDLPPDRID
ncbi:T-complex protein 1 subunit theta-like [Pristis pectinata]|uniref:T-complex protein 1 subunit theta-like n=1 Tax=Pristis pectinata TaxID=685728 RepID=UPI00223CC517|nr:T-complex protein 1 subunit theta-like [Pristis pectinata]